MNIIWLISPLHRKSHADLQQHKTLAKLGLCSEIIPVPEGHSTWIWAQPESCTSSPQSPKGKNTDL